MRWFSNVTLFQNPGNGRAMSYQLITASRTARSHHRLRPAAHLTLSIFDRDWLFPNCVRTSPPREAAEPRARARGGVAVEMMFGERGNRQRASQ